MRQRLAEVLEVLRGGVNLRPILTNRWTPFLGALTLLGVALALAVSLSLATSVDSDEAFVLQSSDGARFVAELNGDGDTWVLLGHMYPTKNTKPTHRGIWDKFANRLVSEGYRVLRWDFRCHGESPCVYSNRPIEDVPDIYREWEAAIDYAVERGAETLYGIGVSMGGTSLMQVAAYRDEFTAVSAISSPNVFPNKPPKDSDRADEDGFDKLDGLASVRDIGVPKLFIAGARNQCAYWQSNRYFKRAGEPTRFVIYETDLHGTEILDDQEIGPDAVGEVLDFLADPYGILGKEKRNLAPEADPNDECWPPEDDEDK
ncbi:MAG: alpha/beta fold hydrolase [Chloroflexi bacterium]|nr:alpha/beta fold hydrolase [Chloroflexota bacterium]MYF21888.1 alpha/beta fold hydrolase [Chloroflexota bacterium]